MGNDLQKGTTYATGGVGGQGAITASNLNEHVDNATIKPTAISARADRTPGAFTDNVLLESGGALYKMLLSTLRDLVIQPGSVLQTILATPYTATTAIGTGIPVDDTIPQITEGTQILSLSITPRSASNQIRLRFNGFGGSTLSCNMVAALFRVGVSNALKTTTVWCSVGNFNLELNLDWTDAPALASAQTYTIRVAGSAGTSCMNGFGSTRLFGGNAACTLVAQEIKV